jgi:DNA ligase-associated metallophosphoesterase
LLLAERAIYLQELETLLIADVHFGKTMHFRKAGIAIPSQITGNEINRLQQLIETTRPKKVYFLGDLFHSRLNSEWKVLINFILVNPSTEFILVKGNHDILPEINYQHPNFALVNEPLLLDKFVLSHHPIAPDFLKRNPQLLHICGHIHPGVKMKGKAKAYFNLPCFHFQKNQLILPAFGRFTGLANIKPKKNDKVFAIANESIIEIK